MFLQHISSCQHLTSAPLVFAGLLQHAGFTRSRTLHEVLNRVRGTSFSCLWSLLVSSAFVCTYFKLLGEGILRSWGASSNGFNPKDCSLLLSTVLQYCVLFIWLAFSGRILLSPEFRMYLSPPHTPKNVSTAIMCSRSFLFLSLNVLRVWIIIMTPYWRKSKSSSCFGFGFWECPLVYQAGKIASVADWET